MKNALAATHAHDRAEALPAAGRARRVLVVDDVADNREVLTRRLVRRGFEVSEAVGGEDALRQIAGTSFDVVLLDIMMPDLSGNEVVQRLRANPAYADLPIIMVTAKSQSEDVVSSLSLGANDYITKPVDFEVALARINAQIDRRRVLEAAREQKKRLEEHSIALDYQLEDTASRLAQETQKREVTEERLRFLAYHDALTGLLNRQGFREALGGVLDGVASANAAEPILMFIDLDGFKAINDTYGHDIGDRLLAEVGRRLREALPRSSLVARLGGDEFAIVLEAPTNPETEAAELIETLSLPYPIGGHSVRVGASCGLATARAFVGDPFGLLNAADLAMYHAKAKGTGCVTVFEPRMLDTQRERRQIEVDLQDAVAEGRFEVHYQPILDMKTRRISGFEALLRWPHKTRGMVAPEVFIPLAEEIGLITRLGTWVLRKACEEAATWPNHICISVNLSPIQFECPSLLPTIVNTLAATGLPPHRLELEITESALLGTEGKNVRILQSIRELGVRVSIDDFGTGYSSLTYLRNFRFDKIKIDRRFVQGLRENASDTAIVRTIIMLGQNIGVGTTAEGVETEDQMTSLAAEGCDQGQGYLFSRPLTAEAARAFVALECLSIEDGSM
ncbi:putative bifunctional diguanylate cyclase/phosphodiesterase [Phreatobacter sp.]|uniref:putative bifunctional diguanylate cyclase/phosphodiesterase n=1 Tax=Phreatobacter sp. TaxID=1966341 RepID=UPI003F70D041